MENHQSRIVQGVDQPMGRWANAITNDNTNAGMMQRQQTRAACSQPQQRQAGGNQWQQTAATEPTPISPDDITDANDTNGMKRLLHDATTNVNTTINEAKCDTTLMNDERPRTTTNEYTRVGNCVPRQRCDDAMMRCRQMLNINDDR